MLCFLTIFHGWLVGPVEAQRHRGLTRFATEPSTPQPRTLLSMGLKMMELLGTNPVSCLLNTAHAPKFDFCQPRWLLATVPAYFSLVCILQLSTPTLLPGPPFKVAGASWEYIQLMPAQK